MFDSFCSVFSLQSPSGLQTWLQLRMEGCQRAPRLRTSHCRTSALITHVSAIKTSFMFPCCCYTSEGGPQKPHSPDVFSSDTGWNLCFLLSQQRERWSNEPRPAGGDDVALPEGAGPRTGAEPWPPAHAAKCLRSGDAAAAGRRRWGGAEEEDEGRNVVSGVKPPCCPLVKPRPLFDPRPAGGVYLFICLSCFFYRSKTMNFISEALRIKRSPNHQPPTAVPTDGLSRYAAVHCG